MITCDNNNLNKCFKENFVDAEKHEIRLQELKTARQMAVSDYGTNTIGVMFANGVISSMLVLGVLPLLESIFKIVTPYALAELADHNQPILKRLQMEAPGTYHHCLMVANLCEAAAEAQAYAFGVDTDHSAQLAANHPDQSAVTVSSAVKQFGWQIRDGLRTIYDGTVVWGSTNTADFDSGYLTMIEGDAFNKVVKEGMPDVYARFEEIVADLTAGNIKVGTAVDATPEYVASELAKATITAGSN